MCGIVGAVSLKKPFIDIGSVKSMTDRIAHRGPDDAGHLFFHTGTKHPNKVSFYLHATEKQFAHLEHILPYIESKAFQRELNRHDWDLYLGHRRLSIIDTSPAGHQPMSDLSKNIWLVYNGEIYNFKALRKKLEEEGHRFLSETDSEVILYSYITWGIDCIHRLKGMFAFAIYDNFKKKLFLVRDRYGIKPLYYTITPDKTFLFASEVKSLLAYSECNPELDKSALIEYFTFQNFLTNRTLWKDIFILEPGHFLEVDLNTNRVEKRQYWDFNFFDYQGNRKEEDIENELHEVLKISVERQLIADVEIGSYLSGGIDSGSITALASSYFHRTHRNYLKTFTVGFDLHSASGLELSYDEREKAEYMSYLFKTEHYEMVLKAGDMERCLPDFAYHLEEPRVGQSYPNYYAAKLASKFVKVVLGGIGGDELFGGYPWRYKRIIDSKDFDDFADRYFSYWQRLFKREELKRVFSPISEEVKNTDTKDIFLSIFLRVKAKNLSRDDFINLALYFEAKTFLHGLLVVEDKLSMAHSLETRVPLLDDDLVELAQRIPPYMKVDYSCETKDSEEVNGCGKKVLKKVMSKYIPANIINAKKQGFSSPDSSWFKGESIEFVKKKLLKRDANIYYLMDYEAVKDLIEEHLSGKANRRLLIWSLINMEEAFKIYGL